MAMFLDGHNKLRSQHALGKTGGIFNETTVADMATMVSQIDSIFIIIPNYKLIKKTDNVSHLAGLG